MVTEIKLRLHRNNTADIGFLPVNFRVTYYCYATTTVCFVTDCRHPVPDRRRTLASTSLITATGSLAMSVLYWTANPKLKELLARRNGIEFVDLTPFEIYLSWYCNFGGGAFFVFVLIWMETRQAQTGQHRWHGRSIWWFAVTFYAIAIPTILFPFSVFALWLLFSQPTKTLLQQQVPNSPPN